MEEKVEKGQASLYVDVTCPICQKNTALSNTMELEHGIHICFNCASMPRERKIEILLLRLLAQKEQPQQEGRFKGQVAVARRRSQILQNLHFTRDTAIELCGIIDHSTLDPLKSILRKYILSMKNCAVDCINQLQKDDKEI